MAIKKAQLFSLIALMMSAFFILVFSGMTRVPLDKDVSQAEGQVLFLNDIVLDFNTLVESSAETSALQILNFSVSHLNGTNYFLDFKQFFYSCFENGSFYDNYSLTYKPCSLSGHNVSVIKQLEEVFRLTGVVYNLDIELSNIDYAMDLSDAYSLEVNVSLLADIKLISIKKNIAWQRKLVASQQVDFVGLKDPASIGTNYVRYIRPAPNGRTFKRVGFDGEFANAQLYIDNTFYFLDDSGPSLFERMQGNQTETFDLIDSRRFGIATIIPAYNLSGYSLYLENVSMIDHHYDWGAKVSNKLLRFFNSSSGINRNITLYHHYVIQGLEFNESQLEYVKDNCDALGCEYS